MSYVKPNWYTDPAHGWLRVEMAEIWDLGIYDQISSFSYLSPSGKYAYLEEGCDATVFIDAYGREKYEAEGIPLNDSYSNRPSHIRDHPIYSRGYMEARFS